MYHKTTLTAKILGKDRHQMMDKEHKSSHMLRTLLGAQLRLYHPDSAMR